MRHLNFVVDLAANGIHKYLTVEDIQKALSVFGAVKITPIASFSTADSTGLTEFVWVYFTGDDEKPYYIVKADGDSKGKRITSQQLGYLSEHGVCTGLSIRHADGEKHGFPVVAMSGHAAASFLDGHGFKADLTDLDLNVLDRGDDGIAQYWVRMMVPDLDLFSKK